MCKTSDGSGYDILLCDTCEAEFHMACLVPPLLEVPEGTWECPKCEAKRHKRPFSIAKYRSDSRKQERNSAKRAKRAGGDDPDYSQPAEGAAAAHGYAVGTEEQKQQAYAQALRNQQLEQEQYQQYYNSQQAGGMSYSSTAASPGYGGGGYQYSIGPSYSSPGYSQQGQQAGYGYSAGPSYGYGNGSGNSYYADPTQQGYSIANSGYSAAGYSQQGYSGGGQSNVIDLTGDGDSSSSSSSSSAQTPPLRHCAGPGCTKHENDLAPAAPGVCPPSAFVTTLICSYSWLEHEYFC